MTKEEDESLVKEVSWTCSANGSDYVLGFSIVQTGMGKVKTALI